MRGLNVKLGIMLVHQLDPGKAAYFLQNVGEDYESDAKKILLPAVMEITRSCTAMLYEEKTFGPELARIIGTELHQEMQPYGIMLCGLGISNIEFDAEAGRMIRRAALAAMEQNAIEAELKLLPVKRELLLGNTAMNADASKLQRRIDATATAAVKLIDGKVNADVKIIGAGADAGAVRTIGEADANVMRVQGEAKALVEAKMHAAEVISGPYLELERIRKDSVKWDAFEGMAKALGTTGESIAKMIIDNKYNLEEVVQKALELMKKK
jgi:hypothetical protein